MNIRRTSLLAFLCLAELTICSADLPIKHGGKETTLNNLPWLDRVMLSLATKFSPKSFEGLPKHVVTEILAYPNIPSIDNFFVDGRQIFTQAKHLAENANLPEFDWGERYEFCIWIICLDWEIRYSTGESKFIGAETITSSTEVTPTSIRNTFEMPLFNWTSSGFLFNFTDYASETFYYAKSSYYSFEDVVAAFQTDYHFVPDIGIQLQNLTIYYNSGRVRGGLMEFEIWDFNGNMLEKYENDPEAYPIDESMLWTWSVYKKEYTAGLQFSLNCFLSNGRSDPFGCVRGENDGLLSHDYYQFLHQELIQSLGLAALLK